MLINIIESYAPERHFSALCCSMPVIFKIFHGAFLSFVYRVISYVPPWVRLHPVRLTTLLNWVPYVSMSHSKTLPSKNKCLTRPLYCRYLRERLDAHWRSLRRQCLHLSWIQAPSQWRRGMLLLYLVYTNLWHSTVLKDNNIAVIEAKVFWNRKPTED